MSVVLCVQPPPQPPPTNPTKPEVVAPVLSPKSPPSENGDSSSDNSANPPNASSGSESDHQVLTQKDPVTTKPEVISTFFVDLELVVMIACLRY